MATVTLKNVSKVYRRGGEQTAAVKDVSLDIRDREFVVLAGPLGCGNSTLVRMIAGLEDISQGEILLGDRRINDVPPTDRDIAMVFHDDALYPGMSIYENMAFGLRRRNFSKTEINKRVQDAAAILGLEPILEHQPKTLGREQRQRAALGRAIVRRPKVLLFDEPFLDLDARSRAQLRMELTQLHQRLETTMIYVTHDPVEALTTGDRLVLMNHGIVQQDDNPLALYDAPSNLFIASFLGVPRINLIEGTLKQERDSLLFCESEGGTIEARLPLVEPAARGFVGKPLVLGIRSEDIQVAQSPKARENAPGDFHGILEIVEPTGAETNLYVQTGAHTIVCRSPSRFEQKDAGRRLQFSMNLEKAHLFDPISTRRVN